MKGIGRILAAGVLVGLGCPAMNAVVIGDLDFSIISSEERTADVAISPDYEYRDSIFVPETVEIDGTKCTVTTVRKDGFSGVSSEYIEFPRSVNILKEGAFRICHCPHIEFATERFEEIGNYAFRGADITSFDTPKLPLDPNKLGWNVFVYSDIEEVDWPEWLSEIPEGMFQDSQVHKLTLPSNLEKIGREAFKSTYLETLTLPDNVLVDPWAFGENYWLRELNLGSGCTLALRSFAINFGMTNLTIPENTVLNDSFGLWANIDLLEMAGSVDFSETISLMYFDPLGWTSVGYTLPDEIFYAEPQPLTVIYHTSNPPAIYSHYHPDDESVDYLFSQNTYEDGCLYMEDEVGVENARKTFPWKKFRRILPLSQYNAVPDVKAEAETSFPEQVFSLSGSFIGNSTESLSPGIYVIRKGAESRKLIVQ